MIHLTDDSGQTGGFSQCVTHCSFPQWWHQAFYNFFTFSCLFTIPLLIMLICNAKIIFTLTQVLHQDPHRMYSLDLGLMWVISFKTAIPKAERHFLCTHYCSKQFIYIYSFHIYSITPGGSSMIISNLQM